MMRALPSVLCRRSAAQGHVDREDAMVLTDLDCEFFLCIRRKTRESKSYELHPGQYTYTHMYTYWHIHIHVYILLCVCKYTYIVMYVYLEYICIYIYHTWYIWYIYIYHIYIFTYHTYTKYQVGPFPWPWPTRRRNNALDILRRAVSGCQAWKHAEICGTKGVIGQEERCTPICFKEPLNVGREVEWMRVWDCSIDSRNKRTGSGVIIKKRFK